MTKNTKNFIISNEKINLDKIFKSKEITAKIKFEHTDGKIYEFCTERNLLNNCQMFTYNNWNDCYAGDLKEIKIIIKNIYLKAKVIVKNLFKNFIKKFFFIFL